MKTLFSEQKIVIENPKYTISLNAEGLSYNTADGKKSLEIKFSEVGAILIKVTTLYLEIIRGKISVT